MLRYKTETRPGLVALHDIRPGNGAGQFLQPRSPHRASISERKLHNIMFSDVGFLPSVLRHRWLGDRKGIQPVKIVVQAILNSLRPSLTLTLTFGK